jgi:hypothetical protein
MKAKQFVKEYLLLQSSLKLNGLDIGLRFHMWLIWIGGLFMTFGVANIILLFGSNARSLNFLFLSFCK